MVQEIEDNLGSLLESAVLYGQNDELFNFLTSENVRQEDFDCILNKIGETLEDCLDFPTVLDNCLLLIGELLFITELSTEQAVILSRGLLVISSNVKCSISSTKRILNTLNKFFDDQSVTAWLVKDKSLESIIVALGRRVFLIGDFECQTVLFEVMCRLALQDIMHWASLWFPSRKLNAKFLSLRPDQFELDSRKILNYINRKEPIPRVFSFVAKSVWLGERLLQKPQGSDFWIDLNYGSQTISFFCSEILNEEDDPPWETVSIFTDMIKNYTICDDAEKEVTTLVLNLKCSCNQLISTSSENVYFERDEVKIILWCPDHNIKKLIARLLEEDYEEEKIDFTESACNEKRKISMSSEITTCDEPEAEFPENDQHKIGRKISMSSEITNFNELEETKSSERKRRKLSETSDLLNVNELEENKALQHMHRKISENENLMEAFEMENDPVLQSVQRKLSEVETHEIQETNILPQNKRKISECIENITSEEIQDSAAIFPLVEKLSESDEQVAPIVNEASRTSCKKIEKKRVSEKYASTIDVISLEQCKTAIDEALTTNNIEKRKTTETDMFKQPVEDESQYIISPTPANPITPAQSKVKKRKSKSSLSLESQKKFRNISYDSPETKVNSAKYFSSVSGKCSASCDLRDEVINLTPQMPPKRVKLFNVDSTPIYNKPLTLKSSQEKFEVKKPSLRSSENKNIVINIDNKVPQQNTNPEESFFDESSSKVKCTQKTKISDKENLFVRDKVNLPLTQVQLTPAPKSNEPVMVDIENLSLPPMTAFSNKESSVERNFSKDAKAKKKTDFSSTNRENTSKKKVKRVQAKRKHESSDEDSDSQIVPNKNSKKKIERKKNQKHISSDEDFYSPTRPNKKPRAAAVRATKKNQKLLKRKELDENSMHSSIMKPKSISEDEISCYSPKKTKTKTASIFQTDTETQSSEISWYKRAKYGLFQTPPLKNYTRKATKGKTSMNKTKQHGSWKKKGYQKKTKLFDMKSSDSGTKSKSIGLSDIDRYSLVIEKESPVKFAPAKKTPTYHFELLDDPIENRHVKNLNHNFIDNEQTEEHSNQKLIDKQKSLKRTENVNRNNLSSKIKLVDQEERSLHCNNLKNNESSNLKIVKKTHKIVKNPLDTFLNNHKPLDDLCLTPQNSIHSFKHQKRSCKSERNEMDSDIQIHETLSDGCVSRKEFTTSDLETGKCDLSKPNSTLDFPETEKNVDRTLSIESLSSLQELQDEESGKKLHMKLFLESLSSESPPPPSSLGELSPGTKISSKRTSSHCSDPVNDCPFKKIKVHNQQNGQTVTQYRTKTAEKHPSPKKQIIPKKTEKKSKQTSNVESDPIITLNLKSERIYIHSEKKSMISPKKQHRDIKHSKTDTRIHQDVMKNNASKMKLMSLKNNSSMEKNMSHSVLTKLASEVNFLTRKLFGTLQKRTWDFSHELNILRSNFLIKIEDMISYNSSLSEKDLKKLALNCKESRLKIQTNMKQLMEIGREYFEAERKKEKRLKCVHRKITVKYRSYLRAAVEVAVKSIEEKIVGRARALLKKFLQGI